MTTTYLIEEAKAARLQTKFTDACTRLAALTRHYDGVIPDDNQAANEDVFKSTSAMITSVQAIHHAIADNYGNPEIDAMYRKACRDMHKQVQELFSAPHTKNISLGTFHDNLWVLANSFWHPLDMSKVEPDLATQQRMRQVRTIVADKNVAPAKPTRPAAKPAPTGGRGQQSHLCRDAAVQLG